MVVSRPPTLAEAASAIAQCRATLRVGSHTFFAASLMLPRAVRLPASALYAFCRVADDEVDEGTDKAVAVARLRRRLDAVYGAAGATHVVDRAFAAVAGHFGIPQALPQALLEGFAWDAEGRRYETLEDLQAYGARVAGSVGAMMAVLMGVRDAGALARACELGVAMQLSNIARDVGEDAAAGRLYLPLAWMREEGLDPDTWLSAPVQSEALARVIARLLRAADALYADAASGVARLPWACRPGINAARLLYAAIGHQVARNGHDALSQRAVVGRRRKLALLGRAMLALSPDARALAQPPLPAIVFLVDAASAGMAGAPASRRRPGLAHRVDDRAGFVIDLFARLAQEERAAMARAGR